jgi:hypothetical protein
MLRLRILLLGLIVASVFFGVVCSSSAQEQQHPANTQYSAPITSKQQPDSPSPGGIERALYAYLTAWRYRFFIEYVGRENILIEEHKEENSAHRTDYESNIGIGDGEEQAMLEVVLGASSKMIKALDQADSRSLKLLADNAQIEQIDNDPELKEFLRQETEIVKETRANLRRDIGEEALSKLDAYVFREFVNREGPVARLQFAFDTAEIEKPTSDRERSQNDSARVRRLYAFSGYFQTMSGQRERSRRSPSAEKEADRALPSCTPDKDREAVREIVVNAGDAIRMTDVRTDADIGQYHKNFGPGPIPRPLPNALVMARYRFWAAVESGVKDLNQQLGITEFEKFNRAVEEIFGSGLWEEAADGTQLAATQP